MPRDVLTLGVADLLSRPSRRREEHLSVEVGDLAVVGSRVVAGKALRIDLLLEALNEAVVVKGTTAATWAGECRRCLSPLEETLRAPILEIFEVDPTEGETHPLVREAVLLELPLAPLCHADCAGLCPQCGIDRNVADCGCAEEEHDPRWAGLDQLHLE
jgi:uncharacterized protein